MNEYKANFNRHEIKAIAAFQPMIRERIEQGWHPSLLTFTFVPFPNDRALPLSAVELNLQRFYSLVLTRQIHHPERGSIRRFPFMVGMPDLPVFKFHKVSAVATINGGLHAHAIFLTPPATRKGRSLAWVIEKNQDLIKGYCHLTSVDCRDIEETPDVTSYVLKSLDLNRFDGDSVWIFPKSRSETVRVAFTRAGRP